MYWMLRIDHFRYDSRSFSLSPTKLLLHLTMSKIAYHLRAPGFNSVVLIGSMLLIFLLSSFSGMCTMLLVSLDCSFYIVQQVNAS